MTKLVTETTAAAAITSQSTTASSSVRNSDSLSSHHHKHRHSLAKPQTSTAEADAADLSPSVINSPENLAVQLSDENHRWVPRWVSTSMNAIANAEKHLFATVSQSIYGRFVPIRFQQGRVWTISMEGGGGEKSNQEKQSKSPSSPSSRSASDPVVMVHGFAGGVGLWAQNLDSISRIRPVHAFDLLGFGRSSRPKFSKDPVLAETEWIQSIEDWRKQMKIEKMILLGHSLGGYLASAYALEYPSRVRHLILADPWGFPSKPFDGSDKQVSLPTWVRAVVGVVSFFNPLAGLRAAGPWGRSMVKRFRPDLGRKFAGDDSEERGIDAEAVYDYIYHCNAQHPSGEIAFKSINQGMGWAKRPMIERLPKLSQEVPITFIYGSRSWVDSGPGYQVQHELRPNSYVQVEVISGAGHHVYADRSEDFNQAIQDVCSKVDSGEDLLVNARPTHQQQHQQHQQQ